MGFLTKGQGLCFAVVLCCIGGGCMVSRLADLPAIDGRTEALEVQEGEACSSGLIPCDEFCIDPSTDRLNCGGCGIVCDVTEECEDGDCVCPDPYEVCGGVCVNTQIDRRHCGECNHACDALASCASGHCDCPTGYEDCGGDCVDLDTDNNNCGSCGNACAGGKLCNGTGSCALECFSPYSLCNPGADAYCADLQTNPFNCSACGTVCPTRDFSIPTCNSGACGISCDGGFGNANGSLEDGCECTITNPTEICDGRDNDCNGTKDDGFECFVGDTRGCTLIASCTGGQICGSSCEWGPCVNNMWDCTSPGVDTDDELCGDGSCGTHIRTCTDTCSWSDWGSCDLTPGNECFVGGTDTQDCGSGNCGTHSRMCNDSCQWPSWGTCTLRIGKTCFTGEVQCCDAGSGANSGFLLCNSTCDWNACTDCSSPRDLCCFGGQFCCEGICDLVYCGPIG